MKFSDIPQTTSHQHGYEDEMERWESRRIYIGDPLQPYAQEQINRAGAEGWELVQIIGFDAWVKRRAVTA